MLRRFVEACQTYASRDALCIQGTHYTYEELSAAVAGLVDLIEASVGSGEESVGVVARDDFLVYAAVFATLLSGRAFVPIHPGLPTARNAELIRQAGLSTIIGGNEPFAEGLRVLDASQAERSGRDLSSPNATEDDLAYLLFTSGSTGTPKGVPITHGNLSGFLDAHQDLFQLNARDRVLQMFDLTFDVSIAGYLVPICQGACAYTVPPGGFRFSAIAELLEREELTIAVMVPSVLTHLRPYFDEIRLPHLRHSYFCGEALHRDVLLEWEACIPNAKITNCYGPTETTVVCFSYAWDRSRGRDKSAGGIVSLGREMSGTRAIVVDGSGQPVSRGEQGELCIAGRQVMPGYWRAPERTASAFLSSDPQGRGQRWYRTGDLAIEDGDGDFNFCGRIDDQVQVQGYRVELGEVESAARPILAPAAVAAVAIEAEHGNTEIHLFVAAENVDAGEVIRRLGEVLPRYMIPASVVVLEALPLNANGKIDRRELRSRAGQIARTP